MCDGEKDIGGRYREREGGRERGGERTRESNWGGLGKLRAKGSDLVVVSLGHWSFSHSLLFLPFPSLLPSLLLHKLSLIVVYSWVGCGHVFVEHGYFRQTEGVVDMVRVGGSPAAHCQPWECVVFMAVIVVVLLAGKRGRKEREKEGETLVKLFVERRFLALHSYCTLYLLYLSSCNPRRSLKTQQEAYLNHVAKPAKKST